MPVLDTLLFSLAVLSSSTEPNKDAEVRYVSTPLKGIYKNFEQSMIQSYRDPLAEIKTAPMGDWKFPQLTVGYGRRQADEPYTHRFRVFSSSVKDQESFGDASTRFLLRLWDINTSKFFLDHNPQILGRAVDVYLAPGGSPGGEQRRMLDPFTTGSDGKPRMVNAIFIYQAQQEMPAIQRARELAHEYGHATLWETGGFSKPETFFNGELGERSYLRELLLQMQAGKITSQDVFGATAQDLSGYVNERWLPFVKQGAFDGPRTSVISKKDEASFYACIGLALWSELILSKDAYRRGMDLGMDKTDPTRTPAGLAEGAAEQPTIEVTLPSWAQNQKIWLPVSKGTVTGAKVLNRHPSGWAQVMPTAKVVVIKNPPVE